jgi:tRNA pseudouridine38-40 synthase
MPKYLLHLAYDGSQFRGWQRQINVASVQQAFEEALSRVLNKETTVFGCGRTDALVHASQYFLQFETDKELDQKFIFIMNKVLHQSIKIYDCIHVDKVFSAQNHALSRTYRYYFNVKNNAFLVNYCSYYPLHDLSIEKMKAACLILEGRHDFYSFCKTPDKHAHTMVNIFETDVRYNKSQGIYCLEIKGDRFLKGMVRAIAHHIIQIGAGKMELDAVREKLERAASYPNIQLAYPQGLYLAKVEYNDLDVDAFEEPLAALLKF